MKFLITIDKDEAIGICLAVRAKRGMPINNRSLASRSGGLMPKLPPLSDREIVKVFQHFGWEPARQRGSHIILVKSGHNVTLSVPDHKAVVQGKLRGLFRSAGLTVEEFVENSWQI